MRNGVIFYSLTQKYCDTPKYSAAALIGISRFDFDVLSIFDHPSKIALN